MRSKEFSYQRERSHYSQHWPKEAKPYLHLEAYLRCWLHPEAVFEGKRVLDLGAGDCRYTRMIAERFRPRRMVACELFREHMLPASQVNRNSALEFVAGDAFRLPFRSQSFDVIFGSGVLCHLRELDRIILELRRVLTEEGCYVGIEPNRLNPVHLYRHLRGDDSSNAYLLGPKKVRGFEKAGFEVSIQYFYAKFPHIRNRLVGTCMGILARPLDGKR